MSKPLKPVAPTPSGLRDPRSTGAPTTRFLPDIAGLKGTKRS
jgi:hypothetical protein